MEIEKQIEFDKIKKIWEDMAVTEYAKERIRGISFCLDEGELRKCLEIPRTAGI